MTGTPLSRADSENLQRLVRQREKVLKSAAKQRSSELLADFENQIGQEYSFDQDEIWHDATEAASLEVKKAQARITARCRELGIPAQFAPSLQLRWKNRGYDNDIQRRRTELRLMAKTRIASIEQKAIVEIELASVQAQTALAASSLTSAAARDFIDKLPTVESLMPALAFSEISGEADPPIAEQLISSNALRQRRYRERQAALRDGSEPNSNAQQQIEKTDKGKD